MQLSRYLDLYLTETQEHLRGLDRALLRIEETGEQAALEEAFRSVHTIKGMSASMGFAVVAELAHEMEDRLDAVRQGKSSVDRDLIDMLLESNDKLARAVDVAVALVGCRDDTIRSDLALRHPERRWYRARLKKALSLA